MYSPLLQGPQYPKHFFSCKARPLKKKKRKKEKKKRRRRRRSSLYCGNRSSLGNISQLVKNKQNKKKTNKKKIHQHQNKQSHKTANSHMVLRQACRVDEAKLVTSCWVHASRVECKRIEWVLVIFCELKQQRRQVERRWLKSKLTVHRYTTPLHRK